MDTRHVVSDPFFIDIYIYIHVKFFDVLFSTDKIRGNGKTLKREEKGVWKEGEGREEQRAKSGNARKRRRRGSGPRPD